VHLKKRISEDDGNRRISAGSVRKYGAEKGLIKGVPAHIARSRGAGSLRRQDHANIYQVGRRASKSFGRIPLAQQQAESAQGLSVAGTAKRKLKFPLFKLLSAIAGAAALAAAAFALLPLTRHTALAEGQALYIGGRMLGVAQSHSEVDQAMQGIQDGLRAAYGMDITQSGELTFTPVFCDQQNLLGKADIESILKGNIGVKVVASVITVNGRPAVALRSEAEARQALDAVLASYKNAPADRYRTDIAFVEDVRIKQTPIDYSLVQPVQDAIRILTLGEGVADNPYTVQRGDSLGKIAQLFSLMISDLRKANPELSITEALQPGQALNAVRPANWVNVRYSETVSRDEALPFATVEQTSDTLYSTQTDVKQEGKNGQRTVWAKLNYIDGMEAGQEEILSQTVITPAQDKIVLRGTKKVPTTAGGGALSTGKFIVPLKSAYRISGVFELRTLNGVTRWHYGDDLAAPTGTPIYASRSGAVSYSGSASGYGLVIYIDHGNGIQTRYGHCSKILVKKGQKVEQGQIIGLVGATGDATGPHLHFEIRINGTPVNPMKYVKL
jgi:murein DD-endopeptidase MepM/ murein hydrolase activator NlpD